MGFQFAQDYSEKVIEQQFGEVPGMWAFQLVKVMYRMLKGKIPDDIYYPLGM